MGAILDVNVAHEVFGGSNRPEAGKQFYDRIKKKEGILVAGGKLLRELLKTSFRRQMEEADRKGIIKKIKDQKVDELTKKLQDEGGLKSNDPHILALAQASGARLLYSNDDDLREDFRNKKLIDKPRGKIYSTKSGSGKFRKKGHEDLLIKLKKGNLCGAPQ